MADHESAWAAYKPGDARPWDLRWAGHLHRRAGFGASWERLQETLALGPQGAIVNLLETTAEQAAFDREYDDYERDSAGNEAGLRAWWLRRMAQTPNPLAEKITLFWLGHFGVSAARARPRLVLDHLQLLRKHGLGDFRVLLDEVSRDPAMLLSMGADANRRTRPNDGFARRFLDQIAPGSGSYAEEDVRGLARAFTGYFVLRDELRYFDREHDTGTKTVLGRTGDFDRQTAVQIVAEQQASAQLVVRKLYRYLISETEDPDHKLLEPLVESFAGDFHVGRLVERMLRSNRFFSAAAYRRRVKSPVEFAVGIVRGLKGNVPTLPLGQHLAELGQNLYRPPTIRGWAGGEHWINRATLIGRSNLAAALLAADGPYAGKLDPAAVAREHGYDGVTKAAEFLADLLLGGDVEADVRAALGKDLAAHGNRAQALRRFAHGLVTLPEFQLT